MADWLTVAEVAAYGGRGTPVGGAQAEALQAAVLAVQAWVQRKRSDLDWEALTLPPETVPSDIRLGAAMLAWRWFERRNSPFGVVGDPAFGFSGILRHDPDIAMLLGIGSSGRVVFAAARPKPDGAA